MRKITHQVAFLLTYKHFTKDQRSEIAILLKKGYSVRDIAHVLGKNPSSVSREIIKNSVKGQYNPEKANHKAYWRRYNAKYQGMKVRRNPWVESYIYEKMQEWWSPEEIAGRLGLEYSFSITAKTIYKYIYSHPFGKPLASYLKYKGKSRKMGVESHWGEIIKNRVFLNERPMVINNRRRYGDFEADTMGKSRGTSDTLAVVRERKSRFILAKKVPQLKYAMDGYKELLNDIPAESVTLDNGVENTRHEELKVSTYFCNPYHSWEKGTVENGIGRIREFIPKKTDLAGYSDKDIRAIVDTINNTPMKCLRWRTPKEVFEEQFLSRSLLLASH